MHRITNDDDLSENEKDDYFTTSMKESGPKVKSKSYKKERRKPYENDVHGIRKTSVPVLEIKENESIEENLQNRKEDEINNDDQALKDTLEEFYLYLETITYRIKNYGIKPKDIQEVWNAKTHDTIPINWIALMRQLSKEDKTLKMEEDKKEKRYIQPLITNLEKFLKGIERLFIALNKAKGIDMDLDFINKNLDLEQYQTEWKRVDIRYIKVNNHNNKNTDMMNNTDFVEKAQKRIAQDIEIMIHLSENVIIERNLHDFIMGRIFKTTSDVQEHFGKNDKKGFKQWKKDLVSFTGIPLKDRTLNRYGEIFRFEMEYKWIIYYPYAPLLQVINRTKGGINAIKLYMENIGFPKGDIEIKSLDWDWNHPPSYFLNLKDAY